VVLTVSYEWVIVKSAVGECRQQQITNHKVNTCLLIKC